MSIYAIGDIQGCFSALERLLIEIQFNENDDVLWFTGDLVNRGPSSLETLRFVKSLSHSQVTVLGNHDLHLLAVVYGVRESFSGDTLNPILSASDKIELIEWLRFQPLMHYDDTFGFAMAHAGIAPPWSIVQALKYAREVETELRSEHIKDLLTHMYGNQPTLWNENLSGMDRLRLIINYFTRMRFCDHDGRLDLTYKGDLDHKPAELIPWYEVPYRASAKDKIIFGHWAALNGARNIANVYPLDTGCVWGNCLTAMRLEDREYFSVKC